MSLFTKLPAELRDPILLCCDSTDLANLTLCSRALRTLITPYLYRTVPVILSDGLLNAPMVSLFHRSLDRNPQLGTFVRKLEIQIRNRARIPRSRGRERFYDTGLGETVLGYVLRSAGHEGKITTKKFEHPIESILDKCTDLRRFIIGDRSQYDYFTYALEYQPTNANADVKHPADPQDMTSRSSVDQNAVATGLGRGANTHRRLKSVTISHSGNERLCFPFDSLPALLLHPGLEHLTLDNLTEDCSKLVGGQTSIAAHISDLCRQVSPPKGLYRDPEPSSITRLSLVATQMAPRSLRTILAMTPRLRYLKYDFWLDCQYQASSTMALSVPDLNLALGKITDTLQSLSLSIKLFHLPRRYADGTGGEFRWLGNFASSDSEEAPSSSSGLKYLDLHAFSSLHFLEIDPLLPLFYGQHRLTAPARLATLLPRSLEQLFVIDSVERVAGCAEELSWTGEDMFRVLSSYALDVGSTAFRKLKLDVQSVQESWGSEQIQGLKTAYHEAGLECEVLSDWIVPLSLDPRYPLILAHHC
ncbi:hypothetical protein BDV96DRAFT_407215 [Lophiotrema nucula]|uniref:F-box domain-containing protein n=1 Tax=Lophiotrema nucula TaxID=690887 RepID=A0A6A5ZGV1_9PLEO|nr:hypothetical protein BDV96DRAFT_407215 [Lophiotrema nucula]